jgi:hypothetical protein
MPGRIALTQSGRGNEEQATNDHDRDRDRAGGTAKGRIGRRAVPRPEHLREDVGEVCRAHEQQEPACPQRSVQT